MTYEAATAYLHGTINETQSRRSPVRLERMRAFLRALGEPHLRYPTIHVGGTSGKGSTATMMAAALVASHRRVGLHTKPHLSSMTERARIDGRAISEERFGELLEELMPAIEATAREFGRPTYYETLLALAFVHFEREAVDVGVIEVGIGGRLDGTNLIVPEVAVITNVGLDHMEILGETIAEIARDKAGIIKPGIPIVSDAREEALAVIAETARGVGAPLHVVAEEAQIALRPSAPYGQAFAVQTEAAAYELALPVLGPFQRRNAATAIVALERLRPDLRPSVAAVERGMGRLVIPGRMEYLPGFPGIVFDVAHNPDKAASLAEALRESFPERRFRFVVSVTESKDIAGVLAPWFALPASFVFTTFEAAGRTAIRPSRLVNLADAAGVGARAIGDPIEALAVARRSADPRDIVVVSGSTFIAGRLRDWWFEHVHERSHR
ncbi:MAG: bifunctional folylpolyglutamate synthase/dihydrofolate synthase [Vulcanimicrobiaceae bacterium]